MRVEEPMLILAPDSRVANFLALLAQDSPNAPAVYLSGHVVAALDPDLVADLQISKLSVTTRHVSDEFEQEEVSYLQLGVYAPLSHHRRSTRRKEKEGNGENGRCRVRDKRRCSPPHTCDVPKKGEECALFVLCCVTIYLISQKCLCG